ncbi:hypothetical protein H0H87_009088 [Tephrocybe sp. NHM501043]|nr:hypothetical protein H0H87_009088 [Tephrocybe sp. NHM501043]
MLSATLLASSLAFSARAYPFFQITGRDLSIDAQTTFVNKAAATQMHDPVCAMIGKATSPLTYVYYPGETIYEQDISHWASSSSQRAKCSVRPDTPEDVAVIVKCGGHASNPGFSSTTGVHISMAKFSEVSYNPSTQTAVIGGGLVWDDVYSALAQFGVNVVGGRKTRVGVAGFTLGGGYSWLTNQYGLSIDTVVAYELVKPTGEIVTVTQETDPGLFFGLKGGMNNFGIVTRFTFKTFPQGKVWGGLILFDSNAIPAVTAATATFSAYVTDPKAAIITSYTATEGQPGISLHLFYDGPTPPAGIFDNFLAIPFFHKNVRTRGFLDLVLSFPSDDTFGQRLKSLGVSNIDYGVQPFLQTHFSHAEYGSSAYPPTRGRNTVPLNIYYAWIDERFDDIFHEVARVTAARIQEVAREEGQDVRDAAIYPNYAIYDTPLEAMYGENVRVLRALKAAVDPMNVMALAGGFKF